MAAQWDEEQTLEEILEQRRMEGSSLQLEAVRDVPESVVHERMSQGTGVEGFKEKKELSGRSMQEMKEKLNIAVEEDIEEMKKWRGLSQSDMDQSWKNLAEIMEEELLDKPEMQNKKVERRWLGKNFLFV